MWIGKYGNQEFPSKYNYYKDKLYSLNPDFEIMNWDNNSIEKLFQEPEYNKYYKWWCNLPIHIQRCDFARYIVVHKYGGLYIDLDFDIHKNLSSLIQDRELLLVKEPKINAKFHRMPYVVFNGFFGAAKQHELFGNFIEHIYNMPCWKFNLSVMKTTGPKSLTKFIMDNYYKEEYFIDTCKILPFELALKKGQKISPACVSQMDTSLAKKGYAVDDPEAYPDGYHNNLGNYADTKWVEGSRWMVDIFTQKPFVIIFIIIVIIILIVICYFIDKSIKKRM